MTNLSILSHDASACRLCMQIVLINSDGDMIVRPSFIEAAVQRRSTSSVAHHLLINYQRAHVAIIKAQFTSKRLRDGMLVCAFPSLPCKQSVCIRELALAVNAVASLKHHRLAHARPLNFLITHRHCRTLRHYCST